LVGELSVDESQTPEKGSSRISSFTVNRSVPFYTPKFSLRFGSAKVDAISMQDAEEGLIADETATALLAQTDQALTAIRRMGNHTDALLEQIKAVRAERVVCRTATFVL
jgi:hypothetical protein